MKLNASVGNDCWEVWQRVPVKASSATRRLAALHKAKLTSQREERSQQADPMLCIQPSRPSSATGIKPVRRSQSLTGRRQPVTRAGSANSFVRQLHSPSPSVLKAAYQPKPQSTDFDQLVSLLEGLECRELLAQKGRIFGKAHQRRSRRRKTKAKSRSKTPLPAETSRHFPKFKPGPCKIGRNQSFQVPWSSRCN